MLRISRARILFARQLSFSRILKNATSVKPSNEDVKLSEEMPGFRAPGAVATDYEIASGLERYELLKTLKGEDPWTDLHPINITALGTPKKPIIVTGIDPERYIGCTGFPADSHPINFITVKAHEDGQVDRCGICGNCFKYVREVHH